VGEPERVIAASPTAQNLGRRKSRAGVLLPVTWPRRLALSVLITLVIGTLLPLAGAFAWGFTAILLCVAGVAALRNIARQKGNRTTRAARAVTAATLLCTVSVAIVFGPRFLAAGGTDGLSSEHPERLVYTEMLLVAVTLMLVFWLPQVFFRIGLDPDGIGDAQGVLLGAIAWTAAIMTGVYVFLLHFDGGPFRGVSVGPLVTGIVFTVFLVAPAYKALARACWRSGMGGVVQPAFVRENWRKALTELGQALERASLESTRIAAVPKAPGSREPGP
jgi:hypothetical protein